MTGEERYESVRAIAETLRNSAELTRFFPLRIFDFFTLLLSWTHTCEEINHRMQ